MAVKKSELYPTLLGACNKLRGGVEPARYKDYVLVLLFFKYVSDRYKGKRFAEFNITPGASFDDLTKLRGNPNVGEETDKIIQKFLESNHLQGYLPDVSFNNADELGSGKELVDKVSGLIGVFQNSALNFKNNVASGDDIIGDAYEYFMMKFAQESGKSKGQFYTPSEVSRVIAQLIGISKIRQSVNQKWTLHDPAAGSGSLLIRAADEAPVDANGKSIVTIYGQEKDTSTAGLAKMNFILHRHETALIQRGNTLADPQYTDEYGQLRRFDFIVMNPPFSDKSWSDGLKPDADPYRRFSDYGVPPEKNGDFAWFLHVLKALDSNGKAGIIMPHGILFRGNAEETIRLAVLRKRWIKGIVSLPANLFYGTGIPACIVIIDKEDAETRDGVFMIDASRGYKKDGNKNRLREQDIEKIVRTFNNQESIAGYSRLVRYDEILEQNGGNLNVPRYIQKPDDALPQNVAAHLKGGIPKGDIDSLSMLWEISPDLKTALFARADSQQDAYRLALPSGEIEAAVTRDNRLLAEADREKRDLFAAWRDGVRDALLTISKDTVPKTLIRAISAPVLETYKSARLVDNYAVYDCLLNYWNEKLQDDVYAIRANGYEAAREIEYVYAKKKRKNESGETVQEDDKSKIKSFDGALIPRDVIEREYFADELAELDALTAQSDALAAELDEMREEESGDEGLLKEVLNAKGDSIPKSNLNQRIRELDEKKASPTLEPLQRLLEMLNAGRTSAMEKLVASTPSLVALDLRNKGGAFGKKKIQDAIKAAIFSATVPTVYQEEYDALFAYRAKLEEKERIDKQIKDARKALDDKVQVKYGALSVDEIKRLLFDKTWMARLEADITNEVEQVVNALAARVALIAKRYEKTLGEIEDKTAKSKEAVRHALERMGYTW